MLQHELENLYKIINGEHKKTIQKILEYSKIKILRMPTKEEFETMVEEHLCFEFLEKRQNKLLRSYTREHGK